jgi:uncharacterized small protein (TIGR04563 family)
MNNYSKRKRSFYLTQKAQEFIDAEAARQDRSASWIVQHAISIAAETLLKYPAAPSRDPEAK